MTLKKSHTHKILCCWQDFSHHVSHWVAAAGAGAFVMASFIAGWASMASTGSEGLNNLNNAGKKAVGVTGDPKTLGGSIGLIVQTILGILGVVFLVLIVYAGFMWMTAQGDETKTKKAVGLIRDAIIGLGITIAANIITYWVMYNLTKSIGS